MFHGGHCRMRRVSLTCSNRIIVFEKIVHSIFKFLLVENVETPHLEFRDVLARFIMRIVRKANELQGSDA